MADKDRLAQRDIPSADRGNGLVRGLGICRAAVLVIREPLRAFLGAFDQALVLVADLAAKLNQQIRAGRRPHWRNKQFLFCRPDEAGGAHAVVKVFIQTAGRIQAQFVILG